MRIGIALLMVASWAFADWSGEYVTNFGPLRLTQDGDTVTGKYGFQNQGSVTGTVKKGKLSLEFRRGRDNGTAELEMDGQRLTGKWKHTRGNGGSWHGWKKHPKAGRGKGKFAGVWYSSQGIIKIEQKGKEVKGTYGAQGFGKIDGVVSGRILNLNWKRLRWNGTGRLEMSADGSALFGRWDGSKPLVWLGQRLSGHKEAVKPKAGRIVGGLSRHPLVYWVRAPKGYRASKHKDAIVLLHGSNWCSKHMVYSLAKMLPDVAKKYVIIGIDGELWQDWSKPDDPRQNYTYANWMGRSTYKGYPFTDRESPSLVVETVRDLRKQLKLKRIFVGGHSQGGFLSFILHQHHPEDFEGVFPMAGGLVIQAEPDVFKDADLMAAQRATPLAILHGENDGVVPFSTGAYIHTRFTSYDFPMLGFFTNKGGHPMEALPVREALNWLDALTTKDKEVLANYMDGRMRDKGWRDLAAGLVRAKKIGMKSDPRVKAWAAALDAAAGKMADQWHKKIAANENNKWVEPFLDWRDQFQFAPRAKKAIEAYDALRKQHNPKAETLYTEARKAMRERDPDTGYERYQEIVDKYYATPRYRLLVKWLRERK